MQASEQALAGSIACAYVLGISTGSVSWVDRAWSLVPALFLGLEIWPYAAQSPVAYALWAAVSVWGARLTWNFWRKGGYSNIATEEDYRWPIVRARFRAVLGDGWAYAVGWQLLFHLGFICMQVARFLSIKIRYGSLIYFL